MKNNLSNIILTILLLCLVPISVLAEDVEIDGIMYSLVKKAKQASVISKTPKYSGLVVIPSTVENDGVEYSVTSIGDNAFYGCTGLTSVTIGNNVTSIGDNAFKDCSGLTSVTIGNNVTSIGSEAFYSCSKLTSVHISDLAAWCKISFKSTPLQYAHRLYLNDEEIKDLVIPNSVTSIGRRSFEYCSGLKSVTIPNSVTSIGDRAFYCCSGLTSVDIPNSVTSMGNDIFWNCYALTSVTIGNSVTSIGDGTFFSCEGLTSVTIGNSVTSIGVNAFTLCTSLTSIDIPNSVTSIGAAAFSSCSGLTSVDIPNRVTSIGYNAFKSCSGLTSVTIGNSIQSIGKEAFANCQELESVTILATSVPKTATLAFDNSYIDYATLMVPDESIDAYKSTEPWSQFGTIKGISGTVVEKEKCATPTISYSNGNISFGCETEGVEYLSSITDTDIRSYTTAAINLSVTYTITVYATKAGYEDSDMATATLCWIDVDPRTEGFTTDATQVMARAVMIQGRDGVVTVSGAEKGTDIAIYSASGQQMGLAKADTNTTSIATHLQKGDVAIVKIGEKSIKVVMQ